MTKPVYQYDLEGNYIASYNSVTEAAKATKLSTSQISNCIVGRFSKTGNYMFKSTKQDKIKPYYKSVHLYDLQGNFIKSFSNIIELANCIEVSEKELAHILNARNNNKRHKILDYQVSYTKVDKCSPWMNLQAYYVPGDRHVHYKVV